MTLQRDAQNKIQMAIITCFNPPKYPDPMNMTETIKEV